MEFSRLQVRLLLSDPRVVFILLLLLLVLIGIIVLGILTHWH